MPRQIGGFRAGIEYLPITALVRMFAAMPLDLAVRVGSLLGSTIMRLDFENRPIAIRNLEIAFPQLDRDARLKILADMYRNWGRVIAEWSHSGELDRDNIENHVTYHDTYNLTQALALAEKARRNHLDRPLWEFRAAAACALDLRASARDGLSSTAQPSH